MKKVCCLFMAVMMLFMSSCSLGAFLDKSEAVNKNVDINGDVINPTGMPAVQETTNNPVSSAAPAEDYQLASADSEGSGQAGVVNDELVPAVVLGGIPDDTWQEDGYVPVSLYLRDSDGFIIPVTQKAVNQAAIAKLTLSRLIDDTVNREELAQYGLYPTIPQETEILGLTIANGIASVDFSSNFLNYKTDLDERGMISSIVYTLTQFPSITGVKITCTGKKLSDMRFGTNASGVLYRANTMINSDKLNVTSDKEKQDIYVFRNSDENIAYCLPVSVEYDANGQGTNFSKTIELMSQFSKKDLATLLPQGSKLIGSSVNKGTITLNFSNDIRRYAGNMREEAIMRQLLYTFGQYKGISNVKILIDGNQNAVLPEGTELSQSFKISKALNLVMD